MTFILTPAFLSLFPSTRIAVLVGHDIVNVGEHPALQQNIDEQTARILKSHTLETISQEPYIAAWREAYRTFGAKPSDYRSSIENLIRMALKGRTLSHINTLVDCYNYISLKYEIPAGGEDLQHIVGDIQLTIATHQEPAVKLLGDQEPEAPFSGEVIYKDDSGAICRCWNWREVDRTKLTEQTKDVVLVLETIPPYTEETLVNAANELKQLVEMYCKGTWKLSLLGKDTLQADL